MGGDHISVRKSDEVNRDIAEVCDRHGMTIAAVVRRAIRVFAFLDRELTHGGELVIRRPDGSETKVLIT